MSCDSTSSDFSLTDIASSAFKTEEDAKKIQKIIDEKEKDLELAAKIGKSLLEQNKELREKNEFLEESLLHSNESIIQLKHQLQQRSSILNAVRNLDEEYYHEKESETNNQKIEKLEKRLIQLEKENSILKDESNSLKEFIYDTELQNNDKINQYLRQLENANLKISKLQSQITEKNIECTAQAAEIKKLVKEIQQRKTSEKNLTEANFDLHKQLTETITLHDQLELDISNLQEAYTEVRSKLQEAESELGNYRLKALPYRSTSSDSLYDSLASELGANDSGFYGTPMISARTESSHSDFHSPGSSTGRKTESESIDSFEVPSKVLIDSLRKNNRKLREKSPSLADELLPIGNKDDENKPSSSMTSNLESIKEASTPSISESLLTLQEPKSKPELSHSESSESDPEDPELRFIEECSPTTSINVQESKEIKTFRDSSCSPIQEFNDWQKVEFVIENGKEIIRSNSPLQSVSPDAQLSPTTSDNEETPRADIAITKSGSNDSLCKYNGPKLGEPGKPGTRDLEYSLRKLNLKKQIEEDYQKFRQARGLPPVSGFFVSSKNENNYPKLCGPLSSQLELLSSPTNEDKAKIPLISRPFPTPKTLAFGKSNWQRDQLGLKAAIFDNDNQGVIQRNVIQSPIMSSNNTSKSADSTPTHAGLKTKHEGTLIHALGLNSLIENIPEDQSKTRSIFRSPLLVGSFEAVRELSPPFGGTPVNDGLNVISSNSFNN